MLGNFQLPLLMPKVIVFEFDASFFSIVFARPLNRYNWNLLQLLPSFAFFNFILNAIY